MFDSTINYNDYKKPDSSGFLCLRRFLMSLGKKLAGVNSGNRKEFDFYPTPEWATEALLWRIREQLNGTIWEPACGDGAISKVIQEFIQDGFCKASKVVSSDLHKHGYGTSGKDFLKARRTVDCIVTNPPYSLATEFIVHARKLAGLVAMLLPLRYLEGVDRFQKIYSDRDLERIFVLSRKPNFRNDIAGSSGLLSMAWFVWRRGYCGDAQLQIVL
jgi:hypothetical protein